jgi:hypothetical protein
MNTQPKSLPLALDLADAADEISLWATAAELRRLHSVNVELLEVLQQMQLALSRCFGPHKAEESERHRALAASRLVIAKAQE